MDQRHHNYSINIYVKVISPARFVDVATVGCTLEDWEDLTGTDEGLITTPHVLIDLNSDIDETHEQLITLSMATARVLLPDLVASLVRKQLEAPYE